MAPVLLDLITQYPILTTLASYLSTLDLFHLALTSRTHHAPILSSPSVFAVLRRDSLCDGRGLRRRQQTWNYRYPGRKIHHDEEIEVRLFATKCDEAGALPCQKCGINICEECREVPRLCAPASQRSAARRPHFSHVSANLLCLCARCDAAAEESLRGQFLHELCDCDVFRRWICRRCVREEDRATREYYARHTVREIEDYAHYEQFYDDTLVMPDDQFDVLFYCSCGGFVPKDARPRCAWCRRRHRPMNEWGQEWRDAEREEVEMDDGCYPVWGPAYAEGYPELSYRGPVYRVPVGKGKGKGRTLPVRSYSRGEDAVS
ncbi:hypothetical protein GGS26DRAFT_380098 [Hypomontagnella submonticulosa]|nr:hypothetical protein GGS26DRAFT_380098 [Hypomontagnella submonticulosa]